MKFADMVKNAISTAKYNGAPSDKAVSNSIDKGKEIEITNPISERTNLGQGPSTKDEFVAEVSDKPTNESVVSSAIDTIQYDPKSKIAHVKFVNGNKNYAYPNVTKDAILKFLNASSKGRYWNYTFNPTYRVAKFRG